MSDRSASVSALFLALSVTVSACDQQSPGNADARIGKLEQQVAALQSRADALQSMALKGEVAYGILGHVNNEPADVSTDTKDYAVAHTMFGPFTVVVEQVEPYLDGYKITLVMGNLTNATFSSPTVTVEWGPAGIGQSKEFQVPIDFLPGRYTRYEFALTPAKANDVKEIQVGFKFNEMKLGVPLDR